jgi:hypothetical protein
LGFFRRNTARSPRTVGLRRAARLCALVLVAAILPLHSADEKHIMIYAPSTSFSLAVSDRDGREYVGLLEALEPLGAVTSRTDGNRWKLRYNDGDSEFTVGKNRARIRGKDIDFPGNFLLENSRGLVPLVTLGTLLPRILNTSVSFNPVSRRLFVGNVATHLTAQLSHTMPPRLVMNFTAPVNPTIATEPGRLRMSFTREPLVAPGTPTLTFGDKAIPSATYAENNGVAEVTVNGTVPLRHRQPHSISTRSSIRAMVETIAAQPSATRSRKRMSRSRWHAACARNLNRAVFRPSFSATPMPTWRSTIAPPGPTPPIPQSMFYCTPPPTAKAFAFTPRCSPPAASLLPGKWRKPASFPSARRPLKTLLRNFSDGRFRFAHCRLPFVL